MPPPASTRPDARATSRNGGLRLHAFVASGQRSRKRHPSGGSSSAGGVPGIPVSFFVSYLTPISGREEINNFVYG